MPQDLKFQFDGDEPKKATILVDDEPEEDAEVDVKIDDEEESVDESIEEIEEEDSSEKSKRKRKQKKYVIVNSENGDKPQISIVTEKPKALQEKSKLFKVTKEFTPTRQVIKRKSDKDPMEELKKLKEKNPIIHHVDDGLIGNFTKIGIKYGQLMQILEPMEVKQRPEWHVKKAKGYLAYWSNPTSKGLEYEHHISETGEFVLDDDKLKDCYEMTGILVFDVPSPGKKTQVDPEALVYAEGFGPLTYDDVISPDEEKKYRKKMIYVLGEKAEFKVVL